MLDKFKLQHKLKDTWTEAEARIFGKISDMTTTETTLKAGSKSDDSSKTDEMLRKQEELMNEINKDRSNITLNGEAVDMNAEAETPVEQAKKTAEALKKRK